MDLTINHRTANRRAVPDSDRTIRRASESAIRSESGPLPNEMAGRLVELFKLLADETRLRILLLLQRSELNVGTLCQLLRQSQPAVSHHLALLRSAGLIEMRRDGKHNFYRLLPQRFEETLRMIFDSIPGDQRQIRFDDFVLSYSKP